MAASLAAFGELFRPANSLATVVRAFRRALSHRRVLTELSSFDDRMLRDIGISRFDVASAWAEPLYRDPTEQLVRRAAETRAAVRSSATERLAFAALLSSSAPGSKR